jgi:hypothetical protein
LVPCSWYPSSWLRVTAKSTVALRELPLSQKWSHDFKIFISEKFTKLLDCYFPSSHPFSLPNITTMADFIIPKNTTPELQGERRLGGPIHAERHINIICVGAGASGILMAYKLQKHFTNFTLTVFEKNPEVSGTWFENRYPG